MQHRHFASISSTNDAAKEWARDESTPASHGAVVTADEQTKGRGRLGRDWVSPAGQGVYLSIVLRPDVSAVKLGQLTIVTALGAALALEKVSGVNIQTKWPNDLLLNCRKIGGILCEAESENAGVRFVVAGVGLNINLSEDQLPARPIFPASSLQIETGREYSVELVREACIKQLCAEYSRYEAGDWEKQRGAFIARCAVIGEPVVVRNGHQEYSGMATGIDEDGMLIVQTVDGLKRTVTGDVDFVR